jgi:hypothetical protein
MAGDTYRRCHLVYRPANDFPALLRRKKAGAYHYIGENGRYYDERNEHDRCLKPGHRAITVKHRTKTD